MFLSVIIPTYKRSTDLDRALNSLSKQNTFFGEVLVIVGPDDIDSLKICFEWQQKIPRMEVIKAAKASLVHSLNLGLKCAKEEIISLIDDDVFLPHDWASKIIASFSSNEKLGAYGGRDKIKLEGQRNLTDPPLSESIGKFCWNGSLKGDHHCGSVKSPVQVDFLKGVSLSFRRKAFAKMKIADVLEESGAEVCTEIDICQSIIKAGYVVVHDNNNYVFHFVSPRQDFDNRTDLFLKSWEKRIFNYAAVVAKFRPWSEILFFSLRSFFVGSRFTPGVFWSILLIKKHGFSVLNLPLKYSIYHLKGLSKGWALRKAN